jgi:hypothetical protein
VAHEVTASFELLAKLGARGEFDLEARVGEGADARGGVGLGVASGEEGFDFAFGLVGGGLEELDVVFGGEMVPQQGKSGEVDGARGEEGVDDGEAASETGGGDAAEGFTFAQAERVDAEVEHRGEASREMEAAVFDFREIEDEVRGELAFGADEISGLDEEVAADRSERSMLFA